MRVTLLLLIGVYACVISLQAQVTFTKYNVPVAADTGNHRLITNFVGDQQLLIPVEAIDSLFAGDETGNYAAMGYGLYVTAFYANNNDLYLVENTDVNGYTPQLNKSTDGGNTFTPIADATGRVFGRDHRNNIFYSTASGFKVSTNGGSSFTAITTPYAPYAVALNDAGDMYYVNDSSTVFKSTDNGTTWQRLYKGGPNSPSYTTQYIERQLLVIEDTLYYTLNNQIRKAAETDSTWGSLMFTSVTSINGGLYVSPDQVYFGWSPPYGLYSTNDIQSGATWTILRFELTTVSGNTRLYNHRFAVADSQIYFLTDTGFIVADRVPGDLPSGISTPNNDHADIQIYPNPAQGWLNVTGYQSATRLYIYNLQGQAVASPLLSNGVTRVDVSSLTPGIYFWRINDQVGKLMLE